MVELNEMNVKEIKLMPVGKPTKNNRIYGLNFYREIFDNEINKEKLQTNSCVIFIENKEPENFIGGIDLTNAVGVVRRVDFSRNIADVEFIKRYNFLMPKDLSHYTLYPVGTGTVTNLRDMFGVVEYSDYEILYFVLTEDNEVLREN